MKKKNKTKTIQMIFIRKCAASTVITTENSCATNNQFCLFKTIPPIESNWCCKCLIKWNKYYHINQSIHYVQLYCGELNKYTQVALLIATNGSDTTEISFLPRFPHSTKTDLWCYIHNETICDGNVEEEFIYG